jgi:hypothetical protein
MEYKEYFLPPSGDDADRTAEIREHLQTYGCCRLGSGKYVVSGIEMPDATTLSGEGGATKLLLKAELSEGFAVKMGSFCAVKDLMVLGAEEEIPLPKTVGQRHGIVFAGTATQKNWANQPRNSIISGCFATGFSGGGITCTDTGYSTVCSLTVSNCHIWNCGAGINITHFSEYHEFSNVLASRNLYGCVNNGGNNVFTGCGFNSNVTGFLIDNSNGQSNNNSHGSAVGCTFNHSDGNKGIGIQILGATSGYVFSGGQMFFSKIVLENAVGIQFHAMNYGKDMDISVTGGNMTLFSNSIFSNPPAAIRVKDNPLVQFHNCYTREGQPVEI